MSEKMSPLAQLMYDAIHGMRVANMVYSDLKSYHFGVQDAWAAVSKALRELDEMPEVEDEESEGLARPITPKATPDAGTEILLEWVKKMAGLTGDKQFIVGQDLISQIRGQALETLDKFNTACFEAGPKPEAGPVKPMDPYADEMQKVRHHAAHVVRYVDTHAHGEASLSSLLASYLSLGEPLKAAAVLVVAHKRNVKLELAGLER